MTENELDVIERALAMLGGITPGPWEADGGEVSQHWSRPGPWQKVVSTDVACMSRCYGGSAQGIESEVDASFIAAAPVLVADLVAEVEKLRADLADEPYLSDRLRDARRERDELRAEVERLRDDIRVERLIHQQCESVDAAIERVREAVIWTDALTAWIGDTE